MKVILSILAAFAAFFTACVPADSSRSFVRQNVRKYVTLPRGKQA